MESFMVSLIDEIIHSITSASKYSLCGIIVQMDVTEIELFELLF